MSQQAARTELREKIANELEFRIQTYDRVRKVKSETSIEDGRRALDGEYPPRFIYPELNNRTVVSLLWELASLCDRRALKQNLRSLARDFNDKFAVGSKFTDSQLDEAVQTLSARLGEILPNAGYSSPIAPKKSR